MVLFKLGESLQFSPSDIKPTEAIITDEHIMDRFKKVASGFKKIAPKANDFLYFSATMMHAAERSLFNDDGSPKLGRDGKPITATWDVDPKTGAWRWNCSDSSVKPYKNNNADIFPASELKIAYKKWVGKPLCKDHQSSSVDGVRGILLDTYWDDKSNSIIALCALDRINYPDLARKVEAGYANSVSMGVAVGRSICSECGNVAKTEGEYCNHVRTKSAYGEINVDLSPIELSIVVNGADPKARIRQIIASTNNIETTLQKVGNSASISQLLEIKEEFNKLSIKLAEIEKDFLVKKDDNNFALKAAAENYETKEAGQKEFQNDLNLLKNKMANVEEMISKIANKFNTEELMSQAKINKEGYFQGTEEPTPGKPKYPKEEADSIRNNEDRQLKNVPEVGPTDGLYPGDMEKKKMLARAQIEERRMIRANAVANAKQGVENRRVAYSQGTEEPKTYPVDPLAMKARKEDKQLQNPTEFGKDALAPGDKETKEKLNRASLKARFVKAANEDGTDDVDNHRWDIISDEKVVLSATLKELSGGKKALYASVSRPDFAREIMKTVKAQGVAEARKLYKSAEEASAGLPAGLDMGVPAEEPVPAGAPAVGAEPMADMAPEGGTAKEEALKGVPEGISDPKEKASAAVDALEENLDVFSKNVQALIPEMRAGLDTMSEGGAPELPAQPEAMVTASLEILESGAKGPEATKALRNMQIVINAGLQEEFKNTITELEDANKELNIIANTLKMPGIDSVNQEFVKTLAVQAMDEASETIKKANALKLAFVKYAHGSYGLEKKAALDNYMTKLAAKKGKKEEEEEEKNKKGKKPVKKEEEETKKGKCGPMAKMPMGKAKKASEEFDLETPEGRKMYRHKIAAQALQVSEMLDKAHPQGSFSLGELDAKTSEATVEDLPDVHSKFEEVAGKDPKGGYETKKKAEQLNELVKAGKVNAAELDELVKNGLDKDVVAYWKKYFGQVDGGSEFATGLVSDFETKKQASVDTEAFKAKIARAYDLAYEMADAGLIANSREVIKREVENIVKWNDDAFDSMKRVIAHHRPEMKKLASANSVEVGIAFDTNVTTGEADKTMADELADLFSSKRSGRTSW